MYTFKFWARNVFVLLMFFTAACSNDDDNNSTDPPVTGVDPIPVVNKYFLGITTGNFANPVDVLSPVGEELSGEVTPVNNGIQVGQFNIFIQNEKQIFTMTGQEVFEFTSFALNDQGKLNKGVTLSSTFIWAADIIDEEKAILVGHPRDGFGPKRILLVDTKSMEISKTVEVDFGNQVIPISEESTLEVEGFVNDVKVRDDKVFISYFEKQGKNFITPTAKTAKLAVLSYPNFKLEKVIEDDRIPNLGRYVSSNVLEQDEKGDIYTFAPSSIMAGFYPLPEKNSGILRIKKGETEFDEDYYIDFEAISGGYKIFDLFYVKNGKAVVKVLKEDESLESDIMYAAYSKPLVQFGILDLNTKEFTLLSDIPTSVGGFQSSSLVEDNEIHVGVFNGSGISSVYTIDVDTDTAKESVKVNGGAPKQIFKISN